MRWVLALFVLISACTTPTAKAPATASTPKEAALSYINALRENRCEQAFAMIEEPLKSIQQKMIQAKGFDAACNAMREQYLPYEKIEFSHEEGAAPQKKVWLRLYREVNNFDPAFINLEQRGSRWVIVGV